MNLFNLSVDLQIVAVWQLPDIAGAIQLREACFNMLINASQHRQHPVHRRGQQFWMKLFQQFISTWLQVMISTQSYFIHVHAANNCNSCVKIVPTILMTQIFQIQISALKSFCAWCQCVFKRNQRMQQLTLFFCVAHRIGFNTHRSTWSSECHSSPKPWNKRAWAFSRIPAGWVSFT